MFTLVMANINLFESALVFVIPFIIFLFFIKQRYGFFSLLLLFLKLEHENVFMGFLILSLLAGIFLFIRKLTINCGKLHFFISGGCFFVVFLASIVEKYLLDGEFSIYCFFSGVVSYWICYYYYELYFSYRGINDKKFDSRIMSFLIIMLGLFLIGMNVIVFNINVSLIGILFLVYWSSLYHFNGRSFVFY